MVRKHFQAHAAGTINDGRLIKSGRRYYVRYMDHADVPRSLVLQDHVLDVLKDMGKTHYIIEKSEAYLHKLLNKGHAIIGTFVKDDDPQTDDRLAAHMIIVYPHTGDETGLADVTVLPDSDLDSISVVSNILVHQDFRGNHLMQQMLREWLKIAETDGKRHAVAEVCADNQFSWSVFLECGFIIYAHGHDDRDGSDLVYVHKPLDRQFVYSAAPQDTVAVKMFDAHERFDENAYKQVKDLLEQGFHGIEYNRRNNTLTLARCIGAAPIPTAANNNAPAP